MANRRMISKSISVSDQTNAIGNFGALLFTWMIPHADDYGVIPGTPGRIKALVVPRRVETEQDIDAALSEMQDVGLIYRYENQGQQYVQLVHFEQHQEGLHKRTVARHPVFDAAGSEKLSRKFREIPGNSRLTEPNLIEPNLTEGNRTSIEQNFTPPPVDKVDAKESKREDCDDEASLTDVVKSLAENICQVKTPVETEVIRGWLRFASREWVLAAIQQAALHKAGSIKYVGTILQAWHSKYQPGDEPWKQDRSHKQRAGPAGQSFAMSKLERMAREAMANEARTKEDGPHDTH